ncbi:hypothetical protein G4177_15125 [Corallococcus sp. ZKHCc1 1396]|uniref:Thiopeptide-type bacteriocin biosynthesis domain-containing protein n=1 Tax=Corallococcus soli TaxID=2710757 RepID=A0ABR9PNL2_9BACT|nr:lantibiotic dehydratase C-terminal domain-containing protein [Corallococcus soli]MBE4749496.1 hypothetical protein [Corallococcus soli]
MSSHREPLLTANIYCDGFIDELIHQVMAPFLAEMRLSHGEDVLLWLMRYSLRGEHLKVRMYGPEAAAGAARKALSAAVDRFMATLPAPVPGAGRAENRLIAALDEEDIGDTPRPDRTLLWTHYRLQPSHMGCEPLSSTAGFAEGYIRCLAEATRVVLMQPLPEGGRPARTAARTALFTRFLLGALAGLGLRPEEECEYLVFHRDWLLAGTSDSPSQAIEFLEHRVAKEGRTLQRLTAIALERHAGRPAPGHDAFTNWSGALGIHGRQALVACGVSVAAGLSPEQRPLFFAAVARVLHNTANVVALDISNEVYLLHLLGHALRPLLKANEVDSPSSPPASSRPHR